MQQHVAMKEAEAATLLHHANLGRAGLTAPVVPPVAGHVSAEIPGAGPRARAS